MEGYTTALTTPSHILPFLFGAIILLFIFTQQSQPVSASSTTPSTSTNTNFIKTSCNTTTYPSLCYKTLSPYAASIQTNPWKLCNTALTSTLKAARKASSLVSTAAQKKGITAREAAVIKDCIENIRNSIDELKQSLQAMGKLGSSPDKQFQMASIKTWVSAAITDENTCTDGFDESKLSDAAMYKIRGGISNFTRVTSNALSLINQLKY